MGKFSLQKAEPYYEQIYQSLKNFIFEGIYQPGDRIFEAKIAKEFNVSRSPVREAVRAIEKEGLLVLNEKQQLTVYEPSLADVVDIYRCRSSLESLAVTLTTESANDILFKEIDHILSLTEMAIKQHENKSVVIDLNTKFHDAILSNCGNKRLQKLLNELKSLTYYYRVLNIDGNDRKETILKEHREIFNAMKTHNANKAAEYMKKHMENDLEHLKKVLKPDSK